MLALLLALLVGSTAADERRLGGLLTLDAARNGRWCWSGTFRFPVGHPLQLGAPGPGGEPGFGVNRNVSEQGGHQGADLDNRRGGDPVRAAGHGLVVSAVAEGWGGGFGAHVVVAHRLMDDSVVFSVYAHLAPGTVRVRAGDAVHAGQTLGRVGRTGRATTEHLHFEIRRPEDAFERWEYARAVDPIAFVAARLPAPDDTTWSRAYLAWAEDAGLVLAGAAADDAIDHARWWTMLARSSRHDLARLPEDPAGLRPALVAAGVIPEETTREAGDTVEWAELQRDLDRLRRSGTRLPPIGLDREVHRQTSARVLPNARGSRRAPPSLAQTCVALAEVAGVMGTADTPAPRERRRGGS